MSRVCIWCAASAMAQKAVQRRLPGCTFTGLLGRRTSSSRAPGGRVKASGTVPPLPSAGVSSDMVGRRIVGLSHQTVAWTAITGDGGRPGRRWALRRVGG